MKFKIEFSVFELFEHNNYKISDELRNDMYPIIRIYVDIATTDGDWIIENIEYIENS
jgi:hypothetical protein